MPTPWLDCTQVALNAELARNFLGDPGSASAINAFVGAYRGSEGLPLYPPMPGTGGFAGSSMPSAAGQFLGATAGAAQSQPAPAVGVPMDTGIPFPQPSPAAPATAPVKAEPGGVTGSAAPAQPSGSLPQPEGVVLPSADVPLQSQQALAQPPPAPPASSVSATPQPDRLAQALAAAAASPGVSPPAAAPPGANAQTDVAVKMEQDGQLDLQTPSLAPHSAAVDAGAQAVDTGLPAPTSLPQHGIANSVPVQPPQRQAPGSEPSSMPLSSPAAPLCDGNSGEQQPALTLDPKKADASCVMVSGAATGTGPLASAARPGAALTTSPATAPKPPAGQSMAVKQPPVAQANGDAGVSLPARRGGTLPPAQPAEPVPHVGPKPEPSDGHAGHVAPASQAEAVTPAACAAAAPAVKVSGNGRPMRSPKGKKPSGAMKGAKAVAAGGGQDTKR